MKLNAMREGKKKGTTANSLYKQLILMGKTLKTERPISKNLKIYNLGEESNTKLVSGSH